MLPSIELGLGLGLQGNALNATLTVLWLRRVLRSWQALRAFKPSLRSSFRQFHSRYADSWWGNLVPDLQRKTARPPTRRSLLFWYSPSKSLWTTEIVSYGRGICNKRELEATAACQSSTSNWMIFLRTNSVFNSACTKIFWWVGVIAEVPLALARGAGNLQSHEPS